MSECFFHISGEIDLKQTPNAEIIDNISCKNNRRILIDKQFEMYLYLDVPNVLSYLLHDTCRRMCFITLSCSSIAHSGNHLLLSVVLNTDCHTLHLND